MDWKRIIGIVGVLVFAGQVSGQSNRKELACDQFLYRDLFQSVYLPLDQRRDDILYLKVVKKQFDHELEITSMNGYTDNEGLISAIYEDADISCLAIGQAFEVMIVYNRKMISDSLMNLPESKDQRDQLVSQFSRTLNVSSKLGQVNFTFSARTSCGPKPRRDYVSTKSLSELIGEELEKLKEPIKLKKN